MNKCNCSTEIFQNLVAKVKHYPKKMYDMDRFNLFGSFISGVVKSHSVFETIKALSVDPAMIFFLKKKGLGDRKFSHSAIKRMYRGREINYLEKKLLMSSDGKVPENVDQLVMLNIYEAGIAEYLRGLIANANCAEALVEDLTHEHPLETMHASKVVPEHSSSGFYDAITRVQSVFPQIGTSSDWVGLYISWNLAFVLGNVDYADIIIPNLLIPSIIDCDASNFLGVRAVSLWLSIWHAYFRVCGNNRRCIPVRRKAMAKAWGKINEHFAQILVGKKMRESPKTLYKKCQAFYAHPF